MAGERKFITENVRRVLLKEHLKEQVKRAGFGGVDIQRTPMGTRVTLITERPGLVIGRKGSSIKALTDSIEFDYGFDKPQVEVVEVENPNLSAQIMAEKLASALERGWHFRRAGHSTVRRVMENGARGCQVIIAGKLTGQRHRTEKFKEGHIKYCGEPKLQWMEEGYTPAKLKQGIIGVKVQIMHPEAKLPDEVEIRPRDEAPPSAPEKAPAEEPKPEEPEPKEEPKEEPPPKEEKRPKRGKREKEEKAPVEKPEEKPPAPEKPDDAKPEKKPEIEAPTEERPKPERKAPVEERPEPEKPPKKEEPKAPTEDKPKPEEAKPEVAEKPARAPEEKKPEPPKAAEKPEKAPEEKKQADEKIRADQEIRAASEKQAASEKPGPKPKVEKDASAKFSDSAVVEKAEEKSEKKAEKPSDKADKKEEESKDGTS